MTRTRSFTASVVALTTLIMVGTVPTMGQTLGPTTQPSAIRDITLPPDGKVIIYNSFPPGAFGGQYAKYVADGGVVNEHVDHQEVVQSSPAPQQQVGAATPACAPAAPPPAYNGAVGNGNGSTYTYPGYSPQPINIRVVNVNDVSRNNNSDEEDLGWQATPRQPVNSDYYYSAPPAPPTAPTYNTYPTYSSPPAQSGPPQSGPVYYVYNGSGYVPTQGGYSQQGGYSPAVNLGVGFGFNWGGGRSRGGGCCAPCCRRR